MLWTVGKEDCPVDWMVPAADPPGRIVMAGAWLLFCIWNGRAGGSSEKAAVARIRSSATDSASSKSCFIISPHWGSPWQVRKPVCLYLAMLSISFIENYLYG
jgi:hypothetical protein